MPLNQFCAHYSGPVRAVTDWGFSVYVQRSMQMRRLIASGLLFAVLMAPAWGIALCKSAPPAISGCAHCAAMQHRSGSLAAGRHAPASSLPVAPCCCQRKAPLPALAESSERVMAPMQLALLSAGPAVAALPAAAVRRVESLAAPPPLASPLVLLCTLRI